MCATLISKGKTSIDKAIILRFWCHYTCSPRQSKFISPDKKINYTLDGITYEVLNLTMYVHPKLACEIYKSCQKTQKVSLTSAL